MMEQSSASSKDVPNNLSTSCNDFTQNFYKELSSNNIENIVSSPLSIHMILTQLSHGAESDTLEEFTKSLCHYDKDSLLEGYKSLMVKLNELKTIKLHVANTMYIADNFEVLTEFSRIGKEIYRSEVSKIDFKVGTDAAETINSWVKERTNNKITDLVSSSDFDESTSLVLINVIYFNGTWLNAFEARNTKDRLFYVTEDQKKLVPTMFHKSRYNHGYLQSLKASFIEIPYTNEDIVMIIILPNEVNGLSSLQNQFSWQALSSASRSNNDVELYLPKFKVEFKVDLEDTLCKVGLKTMFKPNANFTRISNKSLMVSKVLHKAVIEVDEMGTEAAAATVAQIRLRRMIEMEEPEKFIVNRPFMFIIKYKPNNIPLFIGSVRDLRGSTEKDEL